MRWVFFGVDGIRSGFRVAIHLVALLVCIVLSGIAVWQFGLLGHRPGEAELAWAWRWLRAYAVLVAPIAAVTVASGRWLDRGRWRASGLGGPAMRSTAELALGTALGALSILPGIALVAITGGVEFDSAIPTLEWSNWGLWWGVFLCAAALEELIFRGYAFLWLAPAIARGAQALSHVMAARESSRDERVIELSSKALVVCGSSLIFGMVHMGNPGATALSFANTVLAGVWLSVALFRSGAFYLPIGLHWGWNCAQVLLLGLPVSGLGTEIGAVAVTSIAESSLYDANYGIEGSLAATFAIAVSTVAIWFWPQREMADRAAALRKVAQESHGDPSIPGSA